MKRLGIVFFLASSLSLLAASSSALWPWNKAESSSQQQQKKWVHEQQRWNQLRDPRVMERKMQKEHQKWERAQKKKKKAVVSANFMQ